ncbi:MAG: ASKHA domain-containing protein [Candidatus Omnitrophica bacterium]|nr:ASKHA domain-containing protein [Candidatus Omnitrophota bacterium]
MPIIEFRPSGKTVQVLPLTELADAARLAGIQIESPCGGKGTCGKCIVRVVSGEVDSDSLGMLPHAAVAEGYVLTCKTRILESDVTIEVPEQASLEGGQFVPEDESHLIRQELLPRQWQYDPLAVKWRLNVAPPKPEEGLSDLDRLSRAIQHDWGRMQVEYSLLGIRKVADALRATNGLVTATLVRDSGRLHVINIESGDTTLRHYAIAIDVGTTTIAIQLINLAVAQIVAARSDYNDQLSCGLDVISRINYSRRPDRLDELRRRVLGTINRLIHQVAKSHGVDPHEISNAAVSGNTVMTHLLLGLNPEYLRLAPYTPTLLQVPYLRDSEIGIDINPQAWIHFSPCVGSYVGGDITAGILCTDLATETEEINLFIDIGTNGEIVVGNNSFLMACACSAGPAFEGGGIECGMRAATGAIEKVWVDPAKGTTRYSTIGNARPRGICGSGMIDLVARLFLTGWIDAAGKFERSRPCPSIRIEGRRASYVIAPAEESASGKPIVITETDLDNIIRTKASIYSACALMLNQLGLSFGDLSHVYVAGGFGRFLDLENATVIGLIPDLPRGKFHYLGNSSLMGSYMVVVSQEFRQRQLQLAQRMTYLELNTDPSYMEQYTAALFLPHTDPDRFPSVHRLKLKGKA